VLMRSDGLEGGRFVVASLGATGGAKGLEKKDWAAARQGCPHGPLGVAAEGRRRFTALGHTRLSFACACGATKHKPDQSACGVPAVPRITFKSKGLVFAQSASGLF
jgi:hypothetical protein